VQPAGVEVVPIRDHGHDSDGRALGAWGANAGAKYGFVDGTMTVVPYLGRVAPTNLPWRWRTSGVAIDGHDVLGDPKRSEERHLDREFVCLRGPVAERWLVSDEGVEQSFVVDALPTRDGDLVVVGHVESPMKASARSPRHQAIQFLDPAGAVSLNYGAAIAFDASGAVVAVDTSCTGDAVELRVPAAFVRRAILPITIDPLVTVVVTASGGLAANAAGIRDVDLDRVATSSSFSLVETEVRWASATDSDLFVRRTRDDFAVSQFVYSDLATSVAVTSASVAGVDADGSAVVAWSRIGSTAVSSVWFFVLPAGTNDPLPVFAAQRPSGTEEHSAVVAGRKGSTGAAKVLLVRVRERTDGTGSREVWSSIVDCATSSETTPIRLAGSGQFLVANHEAPAVARNVYGNHEPWLVAWQTLREVENRWTVSVSRIRPDGTVTPFTFTPDLPAGATLPHAMRPRVDGSFGRYLLTFLTASSSLFPGAIVGDRGTAVHAQRFDWQVFADNAPAVAHPRVQLLGSSVRDVENGGLAHDFVTSSHWATSFGRADQPKRVARLGYRGLPIEDLPLPPQSPGIHSQTAASLAFDSANERFPLAYGVRHVDAAGAVTWRHYGGRLEHPTLTPPTIRGANCGAIAATQSRFRIGSEHAAVAMIHGGRSRVAICLLSLAPTSVPLASFGFGGGCTLQVDAFTPNLIAAVPQYTDLSGGARLGFPLPEELGAIDLYAQWLVMGDTPADLTATAGMLVEVR
jgi:hypothetical protein